MRRRSCPARFLLGGWGALGAGAVAYARRGMLSRAQVLDPRTMAILDKMVASGFLRTVHGCISTGKEANVYHAFGAPSEEAVHAACYGPRRGGRAPEEPGAAHEAAGEATCEVAVKVFKTSILVFKDRDKYISGDFRFRRGYSKNPRKMHRPARPARADGPTPDGFVFRVSGRVD